MEQIPFLIVNLEVEDFNIQDEKLQKDESI